MAAYIKCCGSLYTRNSVIDVILNRSCFAKGQREPSREESRALLERPVNEEGLDIITNEQLNERKENE